MDYSIEDLEALMKLNENLVRISLSFLVCLYSRMTQYMIEREGHTIITFWIIVILRIWTIRKRTTMWKSSHQSKIDANFFKYGNVASSSRRKDDECSTYRTLKNMKFWTRWIWKSWKSRSGNVASSSRIHVSHIVLLVKRL